MDDLNQALSEEQPAQEPAAPEPEQVAQTGEEAAPPAEQQEDPIQRQIKGLQAATTAEREKRQAAEAKARAYEERLQALLSTQRQEPEQPHDQRAPQAPDPANYTDANAYWADVAEYKAAVAVQRELAKREKQSEEQRKAQEEQARQAAFVERSKSVVTAGQAEYPDFDVAVNNGLAPFLNPTLQQALIFTKNGHRVAYHLAKNPAEAARVASLDPVEMLAELGEIRAKVNAPQRPQIPQTLTQARDARGQFAPSVDETSLEAVLGLRKS